ncbi:PipX family protein [Gloeobacter kilaueensis]|uniref:Uncharacterized protein n=1 Tax=Gloeobacter kilaueensis (strain ATCC BAA-2537 / CCAP 1431/1 / ULC 316 / JS1) TaxID=1183438 RepID=U5QC96_GLOK1|nr:PipX family protein [Gloeobacter kilaueensis]AGY56537.1 hypothetical protein GKIL_0290 [Gloeobacter kilaueensis JS1]
MNGEQYLNHPMFGLLYLICPAGEGAALYSTLYTQQMFFLVVTGAAPSFEPVGREQARRVVENRIKLLRTLKGGYDELERLSQFQQRHF